MNNLKIRCIRLLITLNTKTFNDNYQTKEIIAYSLPNSLHIDVNISKPNAVYSSTATVTIYGMNLEDIFSATKFNIVNATYENEIQIYAGYISQDYINTLPENFKCSDLDDFVRNNISLVYGGQMVTAGVDMNNVNRPFTISSVMTGISSLQQLQNYDHSNGKLTSFSTVIKNIVALYNNTVEKSNQYNVLFSQYYANRNIYDKKINIGVYGGSLLKQIKAICNDYNYTLKIDGNDIYIGTPSLSFGDNPKLLNADNGMIGYPDFSNTYLNAKMYFDNSILTGDFIYLDTQYTPLNNYPYTSLKQGNNDKYQIWSSDIALSTMGNNWFNKMTIIVYKD